MPYPTPYWLPNEEELGKTWRYFYDKYYRKGATIDSYIEMLRDPEIASHLDKDLLENIDDDISLLRIGYYLILTYGRKTSISHYLKVRKQYKEMGARIANKYTKLSKRSHVKDIPPIIDIAAYLEQNDIYETSDILYERGADTNKILRSMHSKYGQKWIDYTNALDLFFRYIEFKQLKIIIEKTWSAESSIVWEEEEYDLLDAYFSRHRFELSCINKGAGIDPFAIEFVRKEPEYDSEFMEPGIVSIHEYFMTRVIADFIDELVAYNRHYSNKGSAQCPECGRIYPRSFYGAGQKYCSNQCKERAKKRRHRDKTRKRLFVTRHRK